MLAGIGITIALQQVHVLLGGKSKSTSWQNVTELPAKSSAPTAQASLLGVLVIGS